MSTDSDGEVDFLEIKVSLKNDAVKKHDLNRQPVFSVDFKNTVYHLDVSHVRRKNPYFDG